VLPQIQHSQQRPLTDINKIPDWPSTDLAITHIQPSIISRPPVVDPDNERSKTAFFTGQNINGNN
jgi:hypothetical protein